MICLVISESVSSLCSDDQEPTHNSFPSLYLGTIRLFSHLKEVITTIRPECNNIVDALTLLLSLVLITCA